MNLIYRKNRMFCIDQDYIKPGYRTPEVINGLYSAIYTEFKGAVDNWKYKNLTLVDRMQNVNIFAEKWLKNRGFYNEV